MQLTLTYPLYTRRTPSNEVAPLGYLEDGSVITIEEVVVGKAIDGNSVWFRTTENVFYWSGGIANIEFVLPGSDFLRLSLLQQEELITEAMDYYYPKLSATIEGFTGMAAAFKNIQGLFSNHYALVIQVKKKTDTPSLHIPALLPYRGFGIPTDVVEAKKTRSNGLGESISRKVAGAVGSAGFLTTKQKGDELYLVTNYHVACADLLLTSPRKMSLSASDKIDEPDMVMPANTGKIFGEVVEGKLDRFSDIAVIRLKPGNFISNNIQSIGPINGVRLLKNLLENFRTQTINVRLFGARSQAVCSGPIESCNSMQTISYLDGEFDHVLKGLIQVRMVTQPGDSGSAVVDDQNALVGILVGGDDKFSYVLPIGNILHNFNLNKP